MFMVNVLHRPPRGLPQWTCRHISHRARAYLKLLPPAPSAPFVGRVRPARGQLLDSLALSVLTLPLLSVLLSSGSSMWKSVHATNWPCGQILWCLKSFQEVRRHARLPHHHWLEGRLSPHRAPGSRSFRRSKGRSLRHGRVVRPLSPHPRVCSITSATPLLTILDNVTTSSSANSPPSSEYESAY